MLPTKKTIAHMNIKARDYSNEGMYPEMEIKIEARDRPEFLKIQSFLHTQKNQQIKTKRDRLGGTLEAPPREGFLIEAIFS